MNKIYVTAYGLIFRCNEYRCSIGIGGIVTDKHEGDGATPAGTFALRKVFYRSDRVEPPQTTLPIIEIEPGFAWCDDTKDPRYNTLLTEVSTSHPESLWREDNIYDVVVEIGYNDRPPVPGKGSAIFLHVARENYSPTTGCIALRLEDLLVILNGANSETKIQIS